MKLIIVLMTCLTVGACSNIFNNSRNDGLDGVHVGVQKVLKPK